MEQPNLNQASADNTPNAHRGLKIAIAVMGFIIIVLVIMLITKPAEAPAPAEEEVLEETAEAADNDEDTNDLSWTPPTEPAPQPGTAPAPAPASAPAAAPAPSNTFTINDPQNLGEEIVVPQSATIVYRDGRFWPDLVYVQEGGRVHFINQSTEDEMWIATDNHPMHDRYPLKSNSTCGSSDFDQCGAVTTGKTWTFTFNRTGTWGYHNHVKARDVGTVVVVSPDDAR